MPYSHSYLLDAKLWSSAETENENETETEVAAFKLGQHSELRVFARMVFVAGLVVRAFEFG